MEPKDRYLKVTEMLESILHSASALDSHGQEILDLLKEEGHENFQEYSDIFMKMIDSAHCLITSNYYIKIIQEMTKTYMKIPEKPQEAPLNTLITQIYCSNGRTLLRNPDKVFSLIKTLVATIDSQNLRSECLLVLFIRSYDAPWSTYPVTDELLDTAKRLVMEGADPTYVIDRTNALFELFQSIFHILVNEGYLFNKLLELIPVFLTENSLKCKLRNGNVLHALMGNRFEWLENCPPSSVFDQYKQVVSQVVEVDPALLEGTDHQGRNALQILIKRSQINIDVLRSMIDVFPLLRSDTNVNAQDGVGRTILHELMNVIVFFPHLGTEILNILPLFTTASNVNAIDNDSVTPYTLVLRGQLLHGENNHDVKGIFSKIEELFLANGADIKLAEDGLKSIPIQLIFEEVLEGFGKPTSYRLQKVLQCLNITKKLGSNSCNGEISEHVLEAVRNVNNPKFLQILLDIMRILVTDQSLAQQVWNYFINWRTLTSMEVLRLCAENGVRPTDEDLYGNLFASGEIQMNEDLLVPFLKILVSFHNIEANLSKIDLEFLVNHYKVSKDALNLGRQLMHRIYMTLDDCLASGKLINCLLFISYENTEILTEESIDVAKQKLEKLFFSNVRIGNWLQQSLLHLAAIYLEESSLKFIPTEIVSMYIDARDLHGCTPLHVAHLHHNKQAIQFLMSHGAEQDAIDNYGMIPQAIGSRVGLDETDDLEEHIDVRHYTQCCRIITAESGVLEELRSMLVLPEEEVNAFIGEVKTLFGRLTRDINMDAEIAIAGSLRERLKVGLLDEADVQIRLTMKEMDLFWPAAEDKEGLEYRLIQSMKNISWDGIFLRPVSIKAPWKFIREGRSRFHGTTFSVDVVPIRVHESEDNSYQEARDEILEDAPKHKASEFSTFSTGNTNTWKDIRTKEMSFCNTPFAFEWNVIDSLPPSFRLAIVISKALVQAYEWCKGDRQHGKMPITSYIIKTAVFHFLVGSSEHIVIKKGLQAAFEDEPDNARKDQTEIGFRKLKYNPNPKWTDDNDLNQFAEDARVLATRIFRLMKYLARVNTTLNRFWGSVLSPCKIGEAQYITDICNCLLQRLETNTFYPRQVSDKK